MAEHVVVITGGGRNIGLQTARALVNRGAKVALIGREQAVLEEAAASLGANALGIATVISDPAEIAVMLARVHGHFGRITGLINNAGIAYPAACDAIDAAELAEQVRVNFIAPVLMARHAIPYLRAAGGGRIINISSAMVHVPDSFAHLAIYSATKAALERFGDELRFELRGDGIGVTNFIAGDTATGFGLGWDPARSQTAYQAWLERGTWCGGMMEASDVGEQIAHLFDLPARAAFDFVLMRPVGKYPKVMEG